MARYTDLQGLIVDTPVRDAFLAVLRRAGELIAVLEFACAQPQALFDPLPEHCAATLQWLTIDHHAVPGDSFFLYRLRNLMDLDLARLIVLLF